MANWKYVLVFVLHLILEATDGLEAVKQRTCVIGAGYAGLAAARYLQQLEQDYTVFEATAEVGGTWRDELLDDANDLEGLPVFTGRYKNLRLNTPRQTMEFAGFPFPEDTPSYTTGTCFHKYVKLFAKNFDLEKNIQLHTFVNSVKWAGDHWNLTHMNTHNRDNMTTRCDYVIVATGQYCKAVTPLFDGIDTYKGNVIHSQQYKTPEPYAGRRVLLVGAGPSGLDLATHLANVTSKLVHSHHLKYNQPYFSETYVKKPDIVTFTSNGAVFEDGSFEEFDDVILCTGYELEFPFLDANAGVTTTGKFVLPLYRHVVSIKRPTMMFIGISKAIITRTMDVQAEFAALIISGKYELPSQERMLKSWLDHVHSLRSKNMKIIHVNVLGKEMDQYYGNLTSEAGVARVPPVLADIRDFNAVYRLQDLLNYRDYDFKLLDDKTYERHYNYREGDPCPIQD